MITIKDAEGGFDGSQLSGEEAIILRLKESSPATYTYRSPDILHFELRMRSEIVRFARMMAGSGAKFAVFRKDWCNPAFWRRTADGGFRLKPGATPAAGIRDIFTHGWLYGFECSTAVIMILYRALLECMPDERFNALFPDLYLHDWITDSDLRLKTVPGGVPAIPGDIQYFANPDFAPATPEWQGENAVKLGPDSYFGHGIGIVTADQMIRKLNRLRRPAAFRSAYLLDQVTSPDYAYVAYAVAGWGGVRIQEHAGAEAGTEPWGLEASAAEADREADPVHGPTAGRMPENPAMREEDRAAADSLPVAFGAPSVRTERTSGAGDAKLRIIRADQVVTVRIGSAFFTL